MNRAIQTMPSVYTQTDIGAEVHGFRKWFRNEQPQFGVEAPVMNTNAMLFISRITFCLRNCDVYRKVSVRF